MTSLKTANSDSETAHFSAPFGSAQIALHASGAWQVTLAADSQPTALNSVAVSDPQDYHPTRQKETKTGPVFSTGTLTAKVTLDPFSLSFSSPKAKAFPPDLAITVSGPQNRG